MKTVSKMRQQAFLGFLGSISLVAGQAFAGTPMMVNPSVSSHPGSPSASTIQRTGTDNLTFRLVATCYGTNLRSVSNPLSPASEVSARINLKVSEKVGETPKVVSFTVKFPGQMADRNGGLTGDATGGVHASKIVNAPEGTTARAYGNTMELKIPVPVTVNIEADGDEVSQPMPPVALDSWGFSQVVNCGAPLDLAPWGYPGQTGAYNCGQYMARNGTLNTTFQNVSVSSDNSSMEVQVAFPGQNGFCGGYFSPLMLFFDEARPKFNNTSKFRLSARENTYWVEAGAPGHFLALDRNSNGRIDDKYELFGDQDTESNGFDALKELDSNKDNVIDAKDKKFKRLVLWNDKNGDGVSQKGELQPLHKKVKSISLDYQKVNMAYGGTAEARQVSKFKLNDGGEGVIEDIWFAPAGKN